MGKTTRKKVQKEGRGTGKEYTRRRTEMGGDHGEDDKEEGRTEWEKEYT